MSVKESFMSEAARKSVSFHKEEFLEFHSLKHVNNISYCERTRCCTLCKRLLPCISVEAINSLFRCLGPGLRSAMAENQQAAITRKVWNCKSWIATTGTEIHVSAEYVQRNQYHQEVALNLTALDRYEIIRARVRHA